MSSKGSTRKPRASKAVPSIPRPGYVLVLRTCAADMTAWGGFKWPASGPVECADWSPRAECGNGLHGLLWGEGNGERLSWDAAARWLVVEVDENLIVSLGDKVKFPRGVVVHCGDRYSATRYIAEHGGAGRRIVGALVTVPADGTVEAGDGSTVKAGARSTVKAGYGSTVKAGARSTVEAGDGSTVEAGDGSTVKAGDGSTVKAGYGSVAVATAWNKPGYPLRAHEVGDGGLKPGVAYRVTNAGEFVEAEPAAEPSQEVA